MVKRGLKLSRSDAWRPGATQPSRRSRRTPASLSEALQLPLSGVGGADREQLLTARAPSARSVDWLTGAPRQLCSCRTTPRSRPSRRVSLMRWSTGHTPTWPRIRPGGPASSSGQSLRQGGGRSRRKIAPVGSSRSFPRSTSETRPPIIPKATVNPALRGVSFGL